MSEMPYRVYDPNKYNIRSKFSQFPSDHILSYREIDIIFSIVYLELQIDEVWEYGSRACLRLDRRYFLSGFRSYDRESAIHLAIETMQSLGSVDLRHNVWTWHEFVSGVGMKREN
jgi:hypothetical protein